MIHDDFGRMAPQVETDEQRERFVPRKKRIETNGERNGALGKLEQESEGKIQNIYTIIQDSCKMSIAFRKKFEANFE